MGNMVRENKMCIIGYGRMGKRAIRLFSGDFEIEVISRQDIEKELEEGAVLSLDNGATLRKANFVFLAVTVNMINKWSLKINELTPDDCVVMDCCTPRIAAEKELALIRRQRFGMPEFGKEEAIIVGKPDKRIAETLHNYGCDLKITTAERYDRETAVTGMAHFLGMALDLNLNVQERKNLESAKSGSYLIQLIEHLKTNSPTTYMETQLLNPYMSETRKRLIKELIKIDEGLDKGIFRFEAYPREKWRQ
jgi:prephenate dehydrogenase